MASRTRHHTTRYDVGGYKQRRDQLDQKGLDVQPKNEGINRQQPKPEVAPQKGIAVLEHKDGKYIVRVDRDSGKAAVLGKAIGEEELYIIATAKSNYPDLSKHQFALATDPARNRYILRTKDEIYQKEPSMRGGGRYLLAEALGEEEQRRVWGQLFSSPEYADCEFVVEKEPEPAAQREKARGHMLVPIRGRVGTVWDENMDRQNVYIVNEETKKITLIGRQEDGGFFHNYGERRWADQSKGEVGLAVNSRNSVNSQNQCLYRLESREDHIAFRQMNSEDDLYFYYRVRRFEPNQAAKLNLEVIEYSIFGRFGGRYAIEIEKAGKAANET